MADVLINDEHLYDIADAIRSKNGEETLYKPSEMAGAIEAIEGRDPDCNGLHVPESALTITASCEYKFANGGWDWFLEQYGDRVTTEVITSASNMFLDSNVEEIPFEFNFAGSAYYDSRNMFDGCKKLKSIGKINNLYSSNLTAMFFDCNRLRQLPEINNWNFNRVQTYAYANCSQMFENCYSLRSIPEELLKELYGIQTSASYAYAYRMFTHCDSLDEIKGLVPQKATLTSNIFGSGSGATFYACGRVRDITFALENNEPHQVSWKSQTIDLTNCVGYNGWQTYVTDYNSGITADKEVKTDEDYANLKDDPDWWTVDFNYARFDKTSAENFINSLPNTSEYLASAGGTNTIKFKGAQGSKSGGAIQDLDEATIALAASKGWTISLT